MELTSDEAKLVAALLRLASEQFSNHGCNDFDLRQYGLEHMAHELNELEWAGTDPDFRPVGDSPVVMDWLMMQIFADKLDPKGETS
jgi:hypothetical protein